MDLVLLILLMGKLQEKDISEVVNHIESLNLGSTYLDRYGTVSRIW